VRFICAFLCVFFSIVWFFINQVKGIILLAGGIKVLSIAIVTIIYWLLVEVVKRDIDIYLSRDR
jgi:hypothetical protein